MNRRATIGERVTEKFGAAGTHWSIVAAYDGGESDLRRLMHALFPGRQDLSIVEIGTHQGVSAAILAEYGIVHTYDVVDWPLRSEIIKHLGVGHRVVFTLIPTANKGAQIQGSAKHTHTIEEGNQWLGAQLKHMDFDVAFIDGNHSYESVKANFEAAKGCGTVIFHDYSHDKGHHLHRTVRFVDGIEREYGGSVSGMEPFAIWKDGRDV